MRPKTDLDCGCADWDQRCRRRRCCVVDGPAALAHASTEGRSFKATDRCRGACLGRGPAVGRLRVACRGGARPRYLGWGSPRSSLGFGFGARAAGLSPNRWAAITARG